MTSEDFPENSERFRDFVPIKQEIDKETHAESDAELVITDDYSESETEELYFSDFGSYEEMALQIVPDGITIPPTVLSQAILIPRPEESKNWKPQLCLTVAKRIGEAGLLGNVFKKIGAGLLKKESWTPKGRDHLTQLTSSLISRIISFLDAGGLRAISQTCSSLHVLVLAGQFWSDLYKRTFGDWQLIHYREIDNSIWVEAIPAHLWKYLYAEKQHFEESKKLRELSKTAAKPKLVFNVEESLSLRLNADGSVASHELKGVVYCEAITTKNHKFSLEFDTLSKTEERKAHILRDILLHMSVDIPTFLDRKQLHFIPPEGEFQLMKYRIIDFAELSLPLDLQIEVSDETWETEFTVKVTPLLQDMEELSISLPLVDGEEINTVKMAPDSELVSKKGINFWQIGQAKKGETYVLEITVGVLDKLKTVAVKWKCMLAGVSSFHLKSLKVVDEELHPESWTRTKTLSTVYTRALEN